MHFYKWSVDWQLLNRTNDPKPVLKLEEQKKEKSKQTLWRGKQLLLQE